MEVARGIHRLETPFGDRVNAVYLFIGARRSLLVDTTTKETANDVLRSCASLGVRSPSYVLNTHSDWDHVAGNGTVRATSPESLILCHELDRAMIEDVEHLITGRYGEFAEVHGFDETEDSKNAVRSGTAQTTIDISLRGGEVIDLGDGWHVTVVHTPGHSYGSISVYDPRSNAYVIGDAVLGAAVPLATGAPAFPPTYRYVDDYLATIDALQHANPALLLTSHYPVYGGGAVDDFLKESRSFAETAEKLLAAELFAAAEPVGLLDVARSLSAQLGDWPAEAAAALLFPLTGHLERLTEAGRVAAVRTPEATVTRYAWVR